MNVPSDESQFPLAVIFELPEQVTTPPAPMVRSVVVQPVLDDASMVTVPVTLEFPETAISFVPMAIVTPVGTVNAVIAQFPPAVIVSPEVQVIDPEVGLLTTQVPIFLPRRLIVCAAVPVSWLGLVELLVKAMVPVVSAMVTLD